ncbi:hypothetical protein BJV85_002852 [Clostridium acetobutylicum]|uniref:Uncharacterized protein n=2 Tax=Clostridium acetobutylicum TaxID=1488 RepID=Q97JX6_CLOAB|nr:MULTISPECIES: hypothetical protein [Clostridium]AAK79119.1 Hypothetical protein CA_C1147 [Clostridium acetobutylicum ATCC 824]ADZ20197.1 Conserved hypothetical protein [Clostridium acetobutylicum EA 2018]AEI31655.1 hypothetical protein SMB_G1167 [Clostridium acetobutylicum DSM 1731]AWV81627.1 hypothetical protein DK921_16320 [Clostridium acetobutylicum]MBC2393271.1 hypothetical protein [Clostridium acetobutylicum]
MNNKYIEMKRKHQKEVNNFPMFFAFSKEQFKEGMKKLGLEPSETNKIYKFGNTGGFYKRTDSAKLKKMLNRHDKEIKEAMKNDTFIFDMFYYELGNHEYSITYELGDTLDSLSLTYEEVQNDKRLLNALDLAIKKIME